MLEQIDRKKYPELNAWIESENSRTLHELHRLRQYEKLESDLIVEAELNGSTPQFFVRENVYLKLVRTEDAPDGIFYLGETGKWDQCEKAFAVADMKTHFGIAVQFAFVTFYKSSLAMFHFSVEGKDVNCAKEYDLEKNCWKLENAYELPTSRGYAKYISADELMFNQALSEDDWTAVKSSRRVRVWKRGQSLDQAQVILETKKENLDVEYSVDYDHNFFAILVTTTWSRKEFYISNRSFQFKKISIPETWSYFGLRDKKMFLLVMEDALGFSKGDVVMYDVMTEQTTLVFRQQNKTYLNHFELTQDYLILDVLVDLACELWIYRFHENDLKIVKKLNFENQSIGCNWAFRNYVAVTSVGYLEPAKTELWNLERLSTSELCVEHVLAQTQTSFRTTEFEVQRYEVSSVDDVMIQYLVISSPTQTMQARPCLMYGYGGFENFLAPTFLGLVGKAWLEKGGIYVVAHIRGGSEYGPDWHQSVLQQNRWKCYEDFANVGKDLVARGLTTPQWLAIRGGSNGGLLVAETARRYPQLFSAVICLKPVINMRKFSHWLSGKYWIDEYGNPDLPEHWEFMQKYCPYTQLDESKSYPPIYLETLSTDDRVHPAHARQFAEKLKKMGFDYLFYESNEGGHMYRVTPKKLAQLEAQRFGFLFLKMNLQIRSG